MDLHSSAGRCLNPWASTAPWLRMLISAWINGEPTSWYAPRFGLPSAETCARDCRVSSPFMMPALRETAATAPSPRESASTR
jgi:hypothetical protein